MSHRLYLPAHARPVGTSRSGLRGKGHEVACGLAGLAWFIVGCSEGSYNSITRDGDGHLSRRGYRLFGGCLERSIIKHKKSTRGRQKH